MADSNDKPEVTDTPKVDEAEEKPATPEQPSKAPTAAEEEPAKSNTDEQDQAKADGKTDQDQAEEGGKTQEKTDGGKTNLLGKWTVYKSEKFEEYLREAGAPWLVRKMASKSYPTLDVTQDGDNICLKLTTMVFTREEKFTLGQEYEITQQDRSVYKAVTNWEDNKLVTKLTPKEEGKGKEQLITREIINGELVMTMEMGNVKATRYFKKH